MRIYKKLPSINKDSQPIKTKIRNKDELFHLFKTDFSDAYENWLKGIAIVRGSRDIGKYCILETGKRKSKSVSNVYTMLMSDILPCWSNFPKRNRSFICATNIDIAQSYAGATGRVYYVFPENNSKIGICSSHDIWYSFVYLSKISKEANYKISIPDICDMFIDYTNFLTKYVGRNKIDVKGIFANENLEEICKLFDFLNEETKNNPKIITKFYDKAYLYWFYRLIQEHDYNLLVGLNEVLDPIKNGFKCCVVKEYHYESEFFKREVWCGGRCLFVEVSYLNDLMGNKRHFMYNLSTNYR